jgi:hypothetical protein
LVATKQIAFAIRISFCRNRYELESRLSDYDFPNYDPLPMITGMTDDRTSMYR